MKLTLEHARAKYPTQVQTDEEFGQAFMSLMREMEISKFMKRTGLLREEVVLVANVKTGKVFPQWVGAVPKEISPLE